MKFNLCFVTVLCLTFIGNTYCYDYEEYLNETIRTIEEEFKIFTNSIQEDYHISYTSVATQVGQAFQDFAEKITKWDSPYAVTHVIQYQRNYTEVPYMLKKVINDSMDHLYAKFTYQNETLYNMIPQLHAVAYDVYQILSLKRCREDTVQQFFESLINSTADGVEQAFLNVHTSYLKNLLKQYSSFQLFNDFISQLTDCTDLSGRDVRDCMVEKDDLYLTGTIGLVRDSLGAVVTVIANLNLKVTDNVAKDVQMSAYGAYRAALLLKC